MEGGDNQQKADQIKAKGNEEFKNGNYLPAISHYSEALELNKHEAILTNRAASYIQLKRYKEALQDCEQALYLNPQFAKAYLRANRCYLQQGDLDKALESAQKALELGEQSGSSIVQQVNKLKQYDNFAKSAIENQAGREALNYANQLLQACPDAMQFFALKIQALILLNRTAEAIDFSTKYQTQFIENPDFLYWRGRLMIYHGNQEMGKKYIREALSKDPDNVKYQKAWKNLVKMEKLKKEATDLFQSHKYTEAIQKFQECLQLDPLNKSYNSTILFNKAVAYSKISQNKEALDDLNKAIELNEDYAKAHVKKGEINLVLENFEDAVRDYEKAKTIDPSLQGINNKIKHAKLELKKSQRKDYYKILGVGKDVTDDQIKKAYKKAALKCHPDKQHSATEEEKVKAEKQFKDVGEAYNVLSDPQKKARYDAGADLDEIENGHGHGHGFDDGVDPNEIFQMFFGGGMGGMGGMGGHQHSHMGGNRGGQQYTFRFN